MERARDPEYRFRSLGHVLDRDALRRSFAGLRGDAAVGVDGVTKQDYERDLETNLQQLHERMRTLRWRHQPIRRVHIPKSRGKTRPIGVSAIEDKVVQGAVAELLSAVYEPILDDGSYGFRPGEARTTRCGS